MMRLKHDLPFLLHRPFCAALRRADQPIWCRSSSQAGLPHRRVARLRFSPILSVSLHAKVPGYVERVLVDRGSVVKQGELLVELSAPEMEAQIAEAESKVQAAEADRLQAEAQLAAAQSTYERTAEGRRNARRGGGQRADPGAETGGSRRRRW